MSEQVTEYKINDIIEMTEEDGQYFWTVREKRMHEGQQFYFMTRPGYEGWFSEQSLSNQVAR